MRSGFPEPLIFISAGEVSGDLYGAGLLQALKQEMPAIHAFGLGGPQMQAAGLRLLADVRSLSAVGLTENATHIAFFWRLKQQMTVWLRQVKPQAVILIDFQGFNLQLAQVAKQLGIPVIYFIAPQDWIWGVPGGLQRIQHHVDLILAVFKPEADFYLQQGIQTEFIGHPLLDLLPDLSQAEAKARLGLALAPMTICWMPGSRRTELKRLLPVMSQLKSALNLKAQHLLPLADTFLNDPQVSQFGAQVLSLDDRYHALIASDLIMAASGTVILEAALLAKPVIALYQVSELTYQLARRVLKRPWITLPNLLLEESFVPEYIQRFPIDKIAQQVRSELKNTAKWQALPEQLLPYLGTSGAFQRAAQAIQTYLMSVC